MSRNVESLDSGKTEGQTEYKRSGLITAIFRSIEQADSLLDALARRNKEMEEELDRPRPVRSSDLLQTIICKCKQAKDDADTVENLKAVNSQLRIQVNELMSQMESRDKKVLGLKEKLDQLEEEYSSLKEDSETEASSSTASFSNSISREEE